MTNIKIKELLHEVQHVKSFLEVAEKNLLDIKGHESSAVDCAGISIEGAHEGFGQLLKALAEAKGSSMRPWLDGVDRIEEVNRERSVREAEATAAGKTVN